MWTSIKVAEDERARQPAALVVGLPWLRSGTGKVLEAQMAFFRNIGWNTLFVAVPHREQHARAHDIWQHFAAHAKDVPHFPFMIQTFDKRIRRERSYGGLRFRRENKTALDFNFQISRSIEITDELRSYIRDNHIKVIIGNHVYTTPFCLKLKDLAEKYWGKVHLSTVTHDIQSYILADNDVINPWTKRQDKIDSLLRCEYGMLAQSDSLIHVSDDDLRSFFSEIPGIPHFLTLPPLAEKTNEHKFPEHAKADLLFVGSNHVANLASLRWYFGHVAVYYPTEPSLTVVGNVSELVRARDEELWLRRSKHFKGSVPDTAPYYARSRVAIAPMVSGRGISVKTIEALAHHKPIVAASHGFRGFPKQIVHENGFRAWDEPADFANAVAATLENPEEHRDRSRRLHKALFTFDRFASSMREVLQGAGVQP